MQILDTKFGLALECNLSVLHEFIMRVFDVALRNRGLECACQLFLVLCCVQIPSVETAVLIVETLVNVLILFPLRVVFISKRIPLNSRLIKTLVFNLIC